MGSKHGTGLKSSVLRAAGCSALLLSATWASAATPSWPAVDGAVFALRTTDIGLPVIAFDAKGRDLMAFNCVMRDRALIGRFHDLVCDGGSFHAKDAGGWVGRQVADSGACTIEMTVTPSQATPSKPGVVFSFGNDEGEDVAILQSAAGLALRLSNAKPLALFAVDAGKPVHVVITCTSKTWTAYRDGKSVRSGAMPSSPAWKPREIVLGATWGGAELWRGRIEGVALFPRALTADEVAAETAASQAILDQRSPAHLVRFRGTLVRQAPTSALEAIRPYSRSLTAAEYKVDKVLDGEWAAPTITVLHWMIMDNKRLPIADRKPGATVELTVEPLEEHPQLESSRRDELETDDDVDLFYCESELPR